MTLSIRASKFRLSYQQARYRCRSIDDRVCSNLCFLWCRLSRTSIGWDKTRIIKFDSFWLHFDSYLMSKFKPCHWGAMTTLLLTTWWVRSRAITVRAPRYVRNDVRNEEGSELIDISMPYVCEIRLFFLPFLSASSISIHFLSRTQGIDIIVSRLHYIRDPTLFFCVTCSLQVSRRPPTTEEVSMQRTKFFTSVYGPLWRHSSLNESLAQPHQSRCLRAASDPVRRESFHLCSATLYTRVNVNLIGAVGSLSLGPVVQDQVVWGTTSDSSTEMSG